MEEKILEIMRQVFKTNNVDKSTTQQNCDNWDSIHHLDFVVELENAFDVEFEPEEIAEMKSFDKVLAILADKI